jgi:ribosome-associated toxin RatA of RatAB toxin-antitoxin module
VFLLVESRRDPGAARTGSLRRALSALRRAALAGLLLAPGAYAAPAEIVVETTRQGDAYVVRARGDVDADAALAWRVLTEYDRYPAFVPDLHSSRVVSRGPDGVVVEQRGEMRFLWVRFPLEVRYQVQERPPSIVESRATSGSFREMTGRYELAQNGAALRVSYAGRLVPDFALPPVIGTIAVRWSVERQFTAMIAEIERQSAAHR